MRRLTLTELQSLEKHFISFLITKGIDADHWQTISESDTGQRDLVIDEFSEMFFNTYLPMIEYLTIREGDKLHVIRFRSSDTSEFILDKTTLSIGYSERKYETNAERLKFELLELGYEITDKTLYNEMSLIYAESQAKLN